jgi:hypothetical protein
MRLRNQRGCLRCTRRKTGPSCWEFLWRENDSDGNRTRRTALPRNFLRELEFIPDFKVKLNTA